MNTTPNGIVLVDKEAGWTSHDAVAKTRRAFGTRKVGHAGTLDPMATGLLVLGLGASTRLLTHLVGLNKTYTTVIRLGISTVTDDREGEVLTRANPEQLTEVFNNRALIAAEIALLTGPIEQAPSAVSAIKVDGRRAYDRVRDGERVELKKRPVIVYNFAAGTPVANVDENGDIASIDIEAEVQCSSGTYIRALARDLGAALGVGGHLVALRRTQVGPFSVSRAISTAQLVSGDIHPEALQKPTAIASQLFPVLELTQQQAIDLGHGKRPELESGQRLSDGSDHSKLAAAVDPDGHLIGLIEVKNNRTRVITNFPTAD